MASKLPDQGLNYTSCIARQSSNHWTTREISPTSPLFGEEWATGEFSRVWDQRCCLVYNNAQYSTHSKELSSLTKSVERNPILWDRGQVLWTSSCDYCPLALYPPAKPKDLEFQKLAASRLLYPLCLLSGDSYPYPLLTATSVLQGKLLWSPKLMPMGGCEMDCQLRDRFERLCTAEICPTTGFSLGLINWKMWLYLFPSPSFSPPPFQCLEQRQPAFP